MNDIRDLILDLQQRGIHLLAEDGRLKSRAAAGAMDGAAAAAIRANKDSILAFLLQRSGGAAQAAPQAAPRGATAPLSATQRRLWLVDRIEGGAQYNLPLAMRLDGELAPAAMQAALDALLARHEVLRSVIVETEAGPCQRVAPARPVPLAVHDLRQLAPDAQAAAVARLRQANHGARFDLAADPMLRATLVRLAEREWLALITVHHIATDGWSTSLMLDEFAHFYNAARGGEVSVAAAAPLPPLPLQYADYAIWQQARLAQPAAQAGLAYWRDQLADLPPVHGIPLDMARTAVKGQQARRVVLTLPAAQCAALRALAQSHSATLFMVLHAALALVFARWSQRADVVIGTPIAGRQQESLAGLIGFFANTVVLRTQVDPHTDFATLLARSKAVCLAAFEHQEVPFDSVIEAIRPERSASYTPGFQLMFAYQGQRQPRAPRLDGVAAQLLAPAAVTTGFDLSVTAYEQDDALELCWDYDQALWLPASVERMATALRQVLEHALQDSAAPIASTVLTGAADLALLDGWNRTRADYPSTLCLHQLIERQAAATPSAPALYCGDIQLSYSEVNGRANALARQLVAGGLRPGQVVAVLMAPALEVPLSFLAIMKAGGAFAPLDITWPLARLQAALAAMDQPPLLAGPDGLPDALAALAHRRVSARALAEELALAPAPDLELALDTEAPIYVMHTSGSTGVPKGALNRHRGVVNRLCFMSRYFGAGPEVVLQTTHHCYDSAVWQFFWPLIKGGSTVLPMLADGMRLDHIAALIERHRVTFSDFTPALLRLFAEHIEQEGGATAGRWHLRHLIVGGEETTAALAQLCRRALPQVGLHNFYGASEASIGSVCYTLPDQPGATVPIGRPIDNVVVAVVGADLASLPVGAPGEILMGGDCVGIGYLGRPDETRRAFVELPEALHGCRRFYRTGDLGRYRADGMLEFLGRIDSQVKIRGFRIELGEIQTALEALPAVRQACLVLDGEGAARRIVAYVVPRAWPLADEAALAGALRAALALVLPDYMLPGAFVALAALPVAASGKIDRRALPAPAADAGRAAYVAPQGEEEHAIAAIWSELLGHERVGRLDNFFALGGHSLLATQLVARLRRRWRIELPLRVVFATPELADLAAHCGALRAALLEETGQ